MKIIEKKPFDNNENNVTIDGHLVADWLLHVDQLKEALDAGHLLALVRRHFLDNFDGHLVEKKSHIAHFVRYHKRIRSNPRRAFLMMG